MEVGPPSYPLLCHSLSSVPMRSCFSTSSCSSSTTITTAMRRATGSCSKSAGFSEKGTQEIGSHLTGMARKGFARAAAGHVARQLAPHEHVVFVEGIANCRIPHEPHPLKILTVSRGKITSPHDQVAEEPWNDIIQRTTGPFTRQSIEDGTGSKFFS